MNIVARLTNGPGHHEVAVATNGKEQPITIAGKPDGGSAVNGGELLFAALATCYCTEHTARRSRGHVHRHAQRYLSPCTIGATAS